MRDVGRPKHRCMRDVGRPKHRCMRDVGGRIDYI